MYIWFMNFSYTNAAGDKVETHLPAFDSYGQCNDWIDIIYTHILQYNHVTNFVAYCDWIKV